MRRPGGEMKVDGQEVYAAADAAARLGVSISSLRVQRVRGKIAGIKVGRDYVYAAAEIDRYRRQVSGRRGFAASTHPLYGKRGGGKRKTGTTTTTIEYDHPDKPDAS
jgi:hypothetical protein